MSSMRLQTFAALNNWTITGQIEAQKDHFARYYVNGTRVALALAEGVFTVLTCVDSSKYYVMTTDWQELEHTAGAQQT